MDSILPRREPRNKGHGTGQVAGRTRVVGRLYWRSVVEGRVCASAGRASPDGDVVDPSDRILARGAVVADEIAGPDPPMLQLAELLDHVDDVVAWVKDRDGRYRWVNRAFLINYTLDHGGERVSLDAPDVVGKTDDDLSPAFLADQYRLDDEYVLTGKRIVNRVEIVGQPAGATAWNVTNKIPLFDAEGAVIGTAGITRKLDAPAQDVAPGFEFGPVLAYMRDHYGSAVTNRHLAKLVHMSVRAFERKFRDRFHLTPQKYLRRLRIRMASRALVYTGQSLAEVAAGCGFSDQSHFTREFRRYFGRTPRDYRDHYARHAAPVPNPAAVEQEWADPGPV